MKYRVESFGRLRPPATAHSVNYGIEKAKIQAQGNGKGDDAEGVQLFLGPADMSLSLPPLQFSFDHCFDPKAGQAEVFDRLGLKMLDSCLEGRNGTIFCYGQTGSGKTYTMMGDGGGARRGLIPRTLESFFDKRARMLRQKQEGGPGRQNSTSIESWCISVSFMEIYNEIGYDLLSLSTKQEQNPSSSPPTESQQGRAPLTESSHRGGKARQPPWDNNFTAKHQQTVPWGGHFGQAGRLPPSAGLGGGGMNTDRKGGGGGEEVPHFRRVYCSEGADRQVHARGLSIVPVGSLREALSLLKRGAENRAVAQTAMNLVSSRSHCIFTMYFQMRERLPSGPVVERTAKLHLVDLAGSERVRRSTLEGKRLQEARHINLSLHHLEHVIVALNIRQQKEKGTRLLAERENESKEEEDDREGGARTKKRGRPASAVTPTAPRRAGALGGSAPRYPPETAGHAGAPRGRSSSVVPSMRNWASSSALGVGVLGEEGERGGRSASLMAREKGSASCVGRNENLQSQLGHVPFRNSLLTSLLRDSFGGSCRTIVISNLSVDLSRLEETISTARFASRCGRLSTEVSVNEAVRLECLGLGTGGGGGGRQEQQRLQEENRNLLKENELLRSQLIAILGSGSGQEGGEGNQMTTRESPPEEGGGAGEGLYAASTAGPPVPPLRLTQCLGMASDRGAEGVNSGRDGMHAVSAVSLASSRLPVPVSARAPPPNTDSARQVPHMPYDIPPPPTWRHQPPHRLLAEQRLIFGSQPHSHRVRTSSDVHPATPHSHFPPSGDANTRQSRHRHLTVQAAPPHSARVKQVPCEAQEDRWAAPAPRAGPAVSGLMGASMPHAVAQESVRGPPNGGAPAWPTHPPSAGVHAGPPHSSHAGALQQPLRPPQHAGASSSWVQSWAAASALRDELAGATACADAVAAVSFSKRPLPSPSGEPVSLPCETSAESGSCREVDTVGMLQAQLEMVAKEKDAKGGSGNGKQQTDVEDQRPRKWKVSEVLETLERENARLNSQQQQRGVSRQTAPQGGGRKTVKEKEVGRQGGRGNGHGKVERRRARSSSQSAVTNRKEGGRPDASGKLPLKSPPPTVAVSARPSKDGGSTPVKTPRGRGGRARSLSRKGPRRSPERENEHKGRGTQSSAQKDGVELPTDALAEGANSAEGKMIQDNLKASYASFSATAPVSSSPVRARSRRGGLHSQGGSGGDVSGLRQSNKVAGSVLSAVRQSLASEGTAGGESDVEFEFVSDLALVIRKLLRENRRLRGKEPSAARPSSAHEGCSTPEEREEREKEGNRSDRLRKEEEDMVPESIRGDEATQTNQTASSIVRPPGPVHSLLLSVTPPEEVEALPNEKGTATPTGQGSATTSMTNNAPLPLTAVRHHNFAPHSSSPPPEGAHSSLPGPPQWPHEAHERSIIASRTPPPPLLTTRSGETDPHPPRRTPKGGTREDPQHSHAAAASSSSSCTQQQQQQHTPTNGATVERHLASRFWGATAPAGLFRGHPVSSTLSQQTRKIVFPQGFVPSGVGVPSGRWVGPKISEASTSVSFGSSSPVGGGVRKSTAGSSTHWQVGGRGGGGLVRSRSQADALQIHPPSSGFASAASAFNQRGHHPGGGLGAVSRGLLGSLPFGFSSSQVGRGSGPAPFVPENRGLPVQPSRMQTHASLGGVPSERAGGQRDVLGGGDDSLQRACEASRVRCVSVDLHIPRPRGVAGLVHKFQNQKLGAGTQRDKETEREGWSEGFQRVSASVQPPSVRVPLPQSPASAQ